MTRFINLSKKIQLVACIVAIIAILPSVSRAANLAPTTSPESSSLMPKPGGGNERTYTITTVVKVLKPCNPSTMNDPYQDVRVLGQTKDCYTLEITYYPLNDAVRAEREERYARASVADAKNYLKPTVTCNWDTKMHADLIAELRTSGIEPSLLSDVQLVQQVSRWAMNRSTSFGSDTGMPSPWYVDFTSGKPQVLAELRSAFDGEKPAATWSDEAMFDHALLGKQMFYNKCHGACTSSSVYLATIFRALGIPARILYFIPPCDGNDPRQVEMLTSAIHHNAIKSAVINGMASSAGFVNHMYNEVFVGGRWMRLNYSTPDQNIVDSNYLGLLAHIDTCRDIADSDLARTWGVRSAKWPDVPERLTSVNPYMLIQAWDHIGKYAQIDNPKAPEKQELTKVTINAVDFPGTDAFKLLVPDSFLSTLHGDLTTDLMLEIAEWLPGQNYHQQREYLAKASHNFVLHASGHPDIHLTLNGVNCNAPLNNVMHQGFGARIADADRSNFVAGVAYTIEPINTSSKYVWTVGPGVVAQKHQ